MKNVVNKLSFCALSLMAVFATSCDDKDEATGYNKINATEGVVATIALVAPLASTQVVNEVNKGVYNFTVTLNKAQIVPVKVEIVQVSGAADGDDVTFDSSIVIPAYSLSASGKVAFKDNDEDIEDDESLVLQIGTITTANATIVPKQISFVIKSTVSKDVNFVFNWDKDFTIGTKMLNLYKMKYDIDFEIYDSAGVNTNNVAAQTGNYPEKLTIKPTTFPDGVYTVKYVVYEPGHVTGTVNTPTSGLDTNFHDPFTIPLNVDYIKEGAERGNKISISRPLSTSVPLTTGEVIKFEINNGTVTVL